MSRVRNQNQQHQPKGRWELNLIQCVPEFPKGQTLETFAAEQESQRTLVRLSLGMADRIGRPQKCVYPKGGYD